jgi:hypothetical protein
VNYNKDQLAAIEVLKTADHRYNFVNRMGPAHVRSVEFIDGVYVVNVWCNIYGHGSVSKILYFDSTLKRIAK